jgi:hypothetical protein
MRPTLRALVVMPFLASSLAGCGSVEKAVAHVTEAPKPPPVPETFKTKCDAAVGQLRPLVVEWPAADRAALEAQARQGQLVVHREGCDLEVLRRCKAPPKRSYSYLALTPKEERATIKNALELYANIPVHAAKLEAKLAEHGELRAEMTIVGEYAVPGIAPAVDQLEGACEGATHVVTALTVGAFSFLAGAASEKGGSVSVIGFGAGVSKSDATESLSRDGDVKACGDSKRGDATPPEGCGALLRVELAPLLAAGEGTPDCKPGTKLVGKACKAVEKPVALAPEDVKFVDEEKGAGWGSRCYLHFRAGALPFARAACKKGLELQPASQTKGMILFNYALVEQATGDPVAACNLLGLSLAVRPNPHAQKMADTLKCSELTRAP